MLADSLFNTLFKSNDSAPAGNFINLTRNIYQELASCWLTPYLIHYSFKSNDSALLRNKSNEKNQYPYCKNPEKIHGIVPIFLSQERILYKLAYQIAY
jgi:hypothetical protein